jgi:hypothetical protein
MASPQPFGTLLSRARAKGLFGVFGLVIAITTPFAPFSWPAAECNAELAACEQRHGGPAHRVHARLLDNPSDRADADEASVTVYVTKTGKKYHRAGCRHLSRSKIPLPLDAAARSYGPCAHCRPPTP